MTPRNRPTRSQWKVAAAIVVATTAVLAVKLPMRIAFLFSRPGLQRMVEKMHRSPERRMLSDQQFGLHTISAGQTNARTYDQRNPQCVSEGRVVFVLAGDHEAAFIYDPRGIENLCYNSGSKGHVMGPWYWMKED